MTPPRAVWNIACFASGVAIFAALRSGEPASEPAHEVAAARPSRPLAFERNDGQTDASVKFVARGSGGAVFVTQGGLTIVPAGAGRRPLRMTFDGAYAAQVDGEARLPGVANYLIGRDPAGWHTGVPLFARATCRGVWPGIDVVFHGDARNVEYDFELAPGADPDAIALRFDGADGVRIDAAGDLVVSAADDEFRHARPRVFEEGREIAGSFVALGGQRAGFRVEGRDPSRRLVIDPVIAYASYLGGGGTENATDVTVDAKGQAYLTGTVNSLDFPRENALPGTPGGASVDAFVTKFNASGANVLFSTYYGGAGADFGWAIRADAGGVYVAGSTTSPDFPSVNAFQQQPAGGNVEGDAFLVKLSSAGDVILYSTYFGGSIDDGCRALAIDSKGNAYLGGFTNSPDFPTTTGAHQRTLRGFGDAWTAKFELSASRLGWSTYFGGTDAPDVVEDLAVDSLGNVYAAGATASTDLPATGSAQPLYGGGALDGFVTKFSSLGALTACTYVGGFAGDGCRRIALDTSGRPHVAGFTLSIDFPVKDAVRPGYYGGSGTGDGFVAELSPALDARVFSTFLGGSDDDDAQGLALAPDGTIFVSGTTSSLNFPTSDPLQPALGGARDAFITKLAAHGAAIIWSTQYGGPALDTSSAVAADSLGDAYVAMTTGDDSLPTLCAYQTHNAGGGQDCYVVKVTEDPSEIPSSPLDAVATAPTPYRVDVTWTDSSRNECAQRVERRTESGGFTQIASPDTNEESITDTDIEPDRTFVYRVFSFNAFGESAPSDLAIVTSPQTLVMGQRTGTLLESAAPLKDRIVLTTSLRFAIGSADHKMLLHTEDFDLALGAQASPFRLHIPAGDAGWTDRGRGRFRWSSPKKTLPRIRIDVDTSAQSITTSISRFDLPAASAGDVFLSLRVGDDAGHISRAWRGVKKKTGAFKLP